MSPFDPTSSQLRQSRPGGPLASSRYTPESRSREFMDSNGLQWTVREIVPEMRTSDRRTLLTRPGYENGWLSFRSEGISCRIAPYPGSWATISEYELERWCMKARDAARVREKRR